MNRRQAIAGVAAGGAWAGLYWYVGRGAAQGGPSLLNASYDATRELYRTLNRMFCRADGRDRAALRTADPASRRWP